MVWRFFQFVTAAMVWLAAVSPAHAWQEKDWNRAYSDFRALPAEKREHLRQLDRDVHGQDAQTRQQLLQTMQRYREWRDRLTPEQRQRVHDASTTEERLKQIRAIREEQWIAALPKADRDRIGSAATPKDRHQAINAVRRREEAREFDHILAQARSENREGINEWINKELKTWVRTELMPKVGPMQRKQLEQMNDRRPANLRMVIRLAERHRVPIPAPLEQLRPPRTDAKRRP